MQKRKSRCGQPHPQRLIKIDEIFRNSMLESYDHTFQFSRIFAEKQQSYSREKKQAFFWDTLYIVDNEPTHRSL